MYTIEPNSDESASDYWGRVVNSLSGRIGEAVRKANPVKTTSRRFQAGTRRTKRAAAKRRR